MSTWAIIIINIKLYEKGVGKCTSIRQQHSQYISQKRVRVKATRSSGQPHNDNWISKFFVQKQEVTWSKNHLDLSWYSLRWLLNQYRGICRGIYLLCMNLLCFKIKSKLASCSSKKFYWCGSRPYHVSIMQIGYAIMHRNPQKLCSPTETWVSLQLFTCFTYHPFPIHHTTFMTNLSI